MKKNKSVPFFLILLVGLCLPQRGQADQTGQSTVVSEPALNQAITETLQQPEFAWRLPREQAAQKEGESTGILKHFMVPLQHFFKGIGVWLGDLIQGSVNWLGENLGSLFEWLKGLLQNKHKAKQDRDFSFKEFSKPAALILIVAIILIILFLLLKSFRNRPVVAEVSSEPIQSVPDLAAETTTADQLEEEQWLALAGEMLEKSELRMALRAFFLASLALLARHRLINIAPFKTNRDYLRELSSRSGHALTDLIEPFRENIRLFEKSWYGDHQISNEILVQVQENANLMRASCG
ncbi:MAG: DUF4129 domain-containing protein [Candidatus Electrothrix aestuarii]|uniref:DUF4129 domain-containing protein n=1 Tax=Candidatus Electrothrix aestuarii TaxID=3062594 RepID=A0AAU8LX93_9BACT|nr:DUF4129 domain-containing protein [Candidatus Electrothrix aestuarii]